jgi:uncharacterized cupredoxin-like copper-binding protein
MTLSSSARRAVIVALGLLAGAAWLLTARSEPPAQAASAKTIRLAADAHGALKFTKTHLTAKAGKITLVMKNPKSAGVSHGIGIQGHGVDKDGKVVAAGKTSRVTVTLKKGTYTYYCPIPSHKSAGMTGKLVVR